MSLKLLLVYCCYPVFFPLYVVVLSHLLVVPSLVLSYIPKLITIPHIQSIFIVNALPFL